MEASGRGWDVRIPVLNIFQTCYHVMSRTSSTCSPPLQRQACHDEITTVFLNSRHHLHLEIGTLANIMGIGIRWQFD